MPDIKSVIAQKLPFVNQVNWIIVFSLLPLIVGILIGFALMILNEI